MEITDLFSELRLPYLSAGHHHCRPGWVQIDCPFCGRDTERFHMGWNLASNYTSCWRCGGHSAKNVLKEIGLGWQRINEVLGELDLAPRVEVTDHRGTYTPPKFVAPMKRAHRDYLRERNFDPKQIADVWDVQGIAAGAGRMSWRLFIPIMQRERPVSWTSRAISPLETQRYLSASAEQEMVNHKHLVYGEDMCHRTIIVCEGPTDAWRIGRGAGALMGTAYTAAQVRRIIEHPMRFVCFDSSPSAQRVARDLCDQLSAFPGVTENIILDADDPGSASKREISLLRKAAKL